MSLVNAPEKESDFAVVGTMGQIVIAQRLRRELAITPNTKLIVYRKDVLRVNIGQEQVFYAYQLTYLSLTSLMEEGHLGEKWLIEVKRQCIIWGILRNGFCYF